MVPPKDPYIKVRVLDDIGNVVLSDQLANLARHAILFIRRTDAEQYISQVIFLYNTGLCWKLMHSPFSHTSPVGLNDRV